MRTLLLSALIFISPLFTFSADGKSCRELFEDFEVQKTIHALAELRLQIDFAIVSNDTSIAASALFSQYQKKENRFLSYLVAQKIMDKPEFLKRIKYKISEIQKNYLKSSEQEREKRQQHQETLANEVHDGTRAVFHRVEAGSFTVKNGNLHTQHVIERPFQLMATHVTQKIWMEIAELANQRGYQFNLDPSISKRFDFPVENVTFNEIEIFIKALNEMSKAGVRELNRIIVGHKKNDHYRLPSKKEWEYVAREGGRYQGNDLFDGEKDPSEYVWFGQWGPERVPLQPVAQKKPFIVGDNKFYDIIGNAFQYVSDIYFESSQNSPTPQRIFTGAAITTHKRYMNYEDLSEWLTQNGVVKGVGLRLAKDVDP